MRITNEMLKEFRELKSRQKQIESRISAIREAIIESNGATTADFIAVVETRSKRQIASLEVFETNLGKNWLEDNGLVRQLEFKVVDVLEKPKKVDKN